MIECKKGFKFLPYPTRSELGRYTDPIGGMASHMVMNRISEYTYQKKGKTNFKS